jgi:L-fucose isomerase-like protein
MHNTPEVKLAIVGVSRDCFPIEVSQRRLAALMAECQKLGLNAFACNKIIERESDTLVALDEAKKGGANAAVVYLGNFGPEAPLSIFAEKFDGPTMVCGAAEESGGDLIGGRGDALCGMLNAAYNFALRGVRVHTPEQPVGLPNELAVRIAEFVPVAKVVIGLRALKVFTFGPRPQDFFACNAPIKALYDLGVEVMENSELDLFQLFRETAKAKNDVEAVAADMAKELGAGNTYPDLLPKQACLELALLRFMEQNLGSKQYGVFADKCWPAFEKEFGFAPCYVNSRLAGKGIPVACEVDIYGAVSEYLAQLSSDHPATLLDINNSVPADLLPKNAPSFDGATAADLFMGFHCGNTPKSCMKSCAMNYQIIMHRVMEDPKQPPNISRGTLEGTLRPGAATIFRLQGLAGGGLSSYIAQGSILDLDPRSFGGIGIIAIPDFLRFYRHVLIGRQFPHHTAVSFAHTGATLFDALKLLGVAEINVPLPAGIRYPNENPFGGSRG